uniref:Keratin, type I cytoskeletal 19-like n=1 Tax=Pseudonaja textilis TaxID=8673 RepID=A0A670ZT57_PSETE
MSCRSKQTMMYTKGRSSSSSCGGIRVVSGISGRGPSSVVSSVGGGVSGKTFSSGVSNGGASYTNGSFGGSYMYGSGGSFRFGQIGGGFGICNETPLISCDEKMTMQNLNDRLASYLEKVRNLEEENAELEARIRQWYDRQGPPSELKDYILILVMIPMDLTVYETELALCQNVEADINGLRQVLDQLTLCRSDLEAQLESLREELCCIKKNHEEEINSLKSQTCGDVSVEVNSSPGPDLKKVLEEMRYQYETMIENNRKEVEQWYEHKIEEVNQEVCISSKEVEDCNNQVVDLKRQLQAMEIDLQAQLCLRESLQDSLGETEGRYNTHLAEIQNQISCVEQQLSELRAEMECQNREYRELLDVKCRLEQEIQTYPSNLKCSSAHGHIFKGLLYGCLKQGGFILILGRTKFQTVNFENQYYCLIIK